MSSLILGPILYPLNKLKLERLKVEEWLDWLIELLLSTPTHPPPFDTERIMKKLDTITHKWYFTFALILSLYFLGYSRTIEFLTNENTCWSNNADLLQKNLTLLPRIAIKLHKPGRLDFAEWYFIQSFTECQYYNWDIMDSPFASASST